MTGDPAPVTRGERARLAILDAAERLFVAQGYNGTSMRQIAQAAGDIAVGGIYNHFGNKEEIFQDLLRQRSPYAELVAQLNALQGDDASALLAQAFGVIQPIMWQHLGFMRLALIDLQEHDGLSIRDLANEVIPHAFAFFARVKQARGIRDDVPSYALARMFVGLMAGFLITGLFAYDGDQPRLPNFPVMSEEDWQSMFMDIWLNGIRAKEE